ncbi:hypothetical protein [Sandaracinobacteroides saxicola]|uniref:Uncharacterized protein n=1 Tax=Sandaracinobacteroides saxicola TaxID=2759707 RepID=A0A7G5IKS4_9SPHN|nr:hypothetical protein [Sandaracinobacteroides saxicola]QMW23966.1 hypothetical protein H3309_05725 [Sandaracinobacteroides saxicola]
MVDPHYYGLIELVLFGAIALGLGFALWWPVRPSKIRAARDAEAARLAERSAQGSAQGSGHAEREHGADER